MENITIKVTEQKVKKQGDLFGIFFEDLNHAADGGLYGELIRNRSFEFDAVDCEGYQAMTAWEKVVRGDSVVQAHVETVNPLNERNQHYLVLEILTDGAGGGIRNEGFGGGIPVEAGKKYRFSCYYRVRGKHLSTLQVRLESKDGAKCYANHVMQPEVNGTSEWKKYECELTSDETDYKARLVLISEGRMRIELDMISLFPAETFKDRKNGLRSDIAQLLADMKPKFMRFPGGCLTHIGSLYAEDRCSIYRWKNTVGPVESRPPRRNNWNYNQTFGLGFYEYFLFCEDIGAEPLPVLSGGYDPHNLRMADLDEMQEWIDDALDLIEFANGDVSTKWGSVRAQMGHTESFHMKYLAIGNEEVGDAFFERYEIIARAVQEKYPEIMLINSAGAGTCGSEFVKGWEQARRTGTAFVDEHFYQCPEWFVANTDRYQEYKSEAADPQAFLGEYASQDDSWKNALAEAAFMTALEKAPGVGLACYAPMLCHTDYKQWHPDMIYYDNHRVYGSPSYYVQKLFMNHQGTDLLLAEDDMEMQEQTGKEETKVAQMQTKSAAVPSLAGTIAFRTQNAQVDIVDFVFEDHEQTDRAEAEKLVRIAGFEISPDSPYQFCLKTDSSDYTVSFRFRKRNGGTAENLEGLCSFELEFAAVDEDNRLCWRIDGWQRLTSLNGFLNGKSCDMGLHHFITEREREYEAKLVVKGGKVQTYLDGVLYCEHCCRDAVPEKLYYSAVKDADGAVIVKAVNVQNEERELTILLPETEKIYDWVQIYRMEGVTPDDRNSFEEPKKVAPTEWEEKNIRNPYQYHMKGHSMIVMRFQ